MCVRSLRAQGRGGVTRDAGGISRRRAPEPGMAQAGLCSRSRKRRGQSVLGEPSSTLANLESRMPGKRSAGVAFFLVTSSWPLNKT